MEKPGISLLDNIIRLYESESDIHISIHDMSGIIQEIPALEIKKPSMVHSTVLCDLAKTSPLGLRPCFKCKLMAINKAISLRTEFEGRCYWGINELVRPVFHNDNLVCIIFVGNYIRSDDLDYFYHRLAHISKLTRQSSKKLLDALPSVQRIDNGDVGYISNIAETIHQIISSLVLRQENLSGTGACMAHQVQTRHWIINSAINYITAYYNRQLTSKSIATLYHISPEYFSRLFKKETGMTYTEYLNWVRVDNAKKMLKVTTKTVVQIAYEVGFNNVTYFNRVFKEQENASPTQYRRSD